MCAAAATAVFLALPAETFRASSLEAGTALRLSLEEVVQRADLALEARVVASAGALGPRGIHTEYTLSVDRTFVGEHESMRKVRLPGGVLSDGRGCAIPGMPRLHVGEDVFLMLGPPSIDGVRVVIGLAQGKYRIVRSVDGMRVALRHDGPLTLIGAEGAVLSDGGVTVVEYAEMLARLTAAAARPATRGSGHGGERR